MVSVSVGLVCTDQSVESYMWREVKNTGHKTHKTHTISLWRSSAHRNWFDVDPTLIVEVFIAPPAAPTFWCHQILCVFIK